MTNPFWKSGVMMNREDFASSEEMLRHYLREYRTARAEYDADPTPENLKSLLGAVGFLEVGGQFADDMLVETRRLAADACRKKIRSLVSDAEALASGIADAVNMIVTPDERDDYRSRTEDLLRTATDLLEDMEKEI